MSERLTEKWYDNMERFDRYAAKSPNIEINCGGDDFQRIIDKLAEYENAEEEGRLVILPCKIGTEIYKIFMDCPKDYKIEYCSDHNGSCENCSHREPIILKFKFTERDIFSGKPVYLTIKEAENALKEMKNNNG